MVPTASDLLEWQMFLIFLFLLDVVKVEVLASSQEDLVLPQLHERGEFVPALGVLTSLACPLLHRSKPLFFLRKPWFFEG